MWFVGFLDGWMGSEADLLLLPCLPSLWSNSSARSFLAKAVFLTSSRCAHNVQGTAPESFFSGCRWIEPTGDENIENSSVVTAIPAPLVVLPWINIQGRAALLKQLRSNRGGKHLDELKASSQVSTSPMPCAALRIPSRCQDRLQHSAEEGV